MRYNQPLIQHISDTARWAAIYRAMESDRPDALLRDPFARRLAGERGEKIAASLPFHNQNSWSWVARTYLFDQCILNQVEDGVDMVVNLAAGLDTRPYRMALPSSLTWVEVDLPAILDYKEEILCNEEPVCTVERVRMDLTDTRARRELIENLGKQSTRGLVVSEGLIIYLSSSEAAALAEDLAARKSFHTWVLDIASPGLLQMVRQNTISQFGSDVAQLKFAPDDGPDFFSRYGWNVLGVKSILRTAAALKRLPKELEPLALLPEDPARMGSRSWSGVCLLIRKEPLL